MTERVTTKRRTVGQIVLCDGCCCGRTEKGHPEVPVDWMKAEWKRRGLAKHVHLSISRCLGPCDATNVVLVCSGDTAVWLGGIKDRRAYQGLLEWATVCARTGTARPLPRELQPFRLERFQGECGCCRAFDEEVA